MLLLKLLNIIHLILFVSIIIPFVVNNKKILTYYLYYLIFVYLGWIIFDNKCWLSIIENRLEDKDIIDTNGNTLSYRIEKLTGYKIDLSKLYILFSIGGYSAILILTYKLDMLYFGVIWVLVYGLFLGTKKIIK